MNLTIYGVNFQNKGAELMLYAVKHQLNEWDINNNLSANLKIGNFKQRNQAGIKHLAWGTLVKKKYARPIFEVIANLANLIPESVRRHNNIVLESEVEAVLDASGFAFSNHCLYENIELMAELCLRWKKQGKKIIFLPQAFGPFTSIKSQNLFKKIINNADLMFARDRISYQYIKQLSVPLEKVKIAPDFTNLVKGYLPEYAKLLKGRPCVIPNQRMLDRTTKKTSVKYIDFIVECLNYLSQNNLNPFILIHETKDIKIGKSIQAKASNHVPIIQENNPLYLKGILSNCNLIISSRFHGIVSGLSQGVPCLGTGWSHKYQMLFDSYNCSDLLMQIETDIQSNLDKINIVINEPTRTKLIEQIKQQAEIQKSLTIKMWTEVKNILDSQE